MKKFELVVLAIVATAVFGFVFVLQVKAIPTSGEFLRLILHPLRSAPTSSIYKIPTNAEPATLYQPALDYERAVIAAVKRASPAVVSIVISKYVPIVEQCAYNPFGDLPSEFRRFFGDTPKFSRPCDTGKSQLQEVGGGSGFIITEDGLVVTNKHVVLDESASYTVFTGDGKKFEAKVLARHPIFDIAVLKIEAVGLSAVALGDSDSVELGQTAIAIGNALSEFQNTVSVGVVSGLSRTITAGGDGGFVEQIEGVIQTDAAINRGNSGGPLLNLSGEVIGINVAVAEDAQGVGFALPINQVRQAIVSVTRTGEIHVPYLGVRYTSITPELSEQERLSVDYGALLRGDEDGPAVLSGSPAAKAGLREKDIILEINGIVIGRGRSLGNIISGLNVGDSVQLKILRGGKEMTLTAILERREE